MTKRVTKPRRRKLCQACGAPIDQAPTGRPRAHCSPACRQRAHRRRRTTTTPIWHRRESDEWATPRDRFHEWDQELGPFTLDVAATPGNAVCDSYFTVEIDGLTQEWTGVVWCNPPYSNVGAWVEKAHRSAEQGATVAVLIPARTDTRWWHQWAVQAEIRFLQGRLKFSGAQTGAPFPSALLVFRPPAQPDRRPA